MSTPVSEYLLRVGSACVEKRRYERFGFQSSRWEWRIDHVQNFLEVSLRNKEFQHQAKSKLDKTYRPGFSSVTASLYSLLRPRPLTSPPSPWESTRRRLYPPRTPGAGCSNHRLQPAETISWSVPSTTATPSALRPASATLDRCKHLKSRWCCAEKMTRQPSGGIL